MKSKELLKKRLINLASGELAAVVVFWMNFFLLKKWILTTKAFISISFSLFLLTFILIQSRICCKVYGKDIQDIEEIGFYFTSCGNFCDIIESRRVFYVYHFFFNLDVCSYRVGKLLSIAIVLQLKSCCFMEILST